MREVCYKCFRPLSSCYCKYVKKVDCGVKFIFLMHPKEAKKQKTGTGRLAHLCLPESEIFVGIDFTNNKQLNDLLQNPKYYPVLMYPSDNAVNASSESLAVELKDKILMPIIIDSTWFCSRKILKTSKNLMTLPRFSFMNQYKSVFTFKTEPKEYCVSTIETCYYLINELKEQKLVNINCDTKPLMNVFTKMIEFQLKKENERIESGLPGAHAYDSKYTKLKEIPTFNF